MWQSGNGLGGWKTVGRQWGPIHTASQRAVLSRGSPDDGGGAGNSLVSPQESTQVPRVPRELADPPSSQGVLPLQATTAQRSISRWLAFVKAAGGKKGQRLGN